VEIGAEPQALSLQNVHEPSTPLTGLLTDTLDLLTLWLRLGLRQQTASSLMRSADQVDRLRTMGLTRCAALLQTVQTQLHAAQRSALLDPLSTLTLLAQDVTQHVDVQADGVNSFA
jgi:hypothetical protein